MSNIKPEKKKRPINQIKIAGTQILNIDLNQGWEITNVEFEDCYPSSYLDKLVVTFEKQKREEYKIHDEQNIGTTQTSEIESVTINPPINEIEEQPTIQPKIIQCKDCINYDGEWCYKNRHYLEDYDFCSRAERRTDE